jgi:hypothetical protein
MALLQDFYSAVSLSVPSSFSIAELSACTLDGEFALVDSGFVLSDSPDSAVMRARIVVSRVDARAVVASWSAAWVHGAIFNAPPRHTVALRDGLRLRLSPEHRYDIAQMAFEPQDVEGSLGAYVTTPLRTAIDLARFTSEDPRLEGALMTLLSMASATEEDVSDVLERGNNLPYKQRAYRRLRAALAALVLDDDLALVVVSPR